MREKKKGGCTPDRLAAVKVAAVVGKRVFVDARAFQRRAPEQAGLPAAGLPEMLKGVELLLIFNVHAHPDARCRVQVPQRKRCHAHRPRAQVEEGNDPKVKGPFFCIVVHCTRRRHAKARTSKGSQGRRQPSPLSATKAHMYARAHTHFGVTHPLS